ncbi:MAG: general secretion pathway protein GspK [Proteobacteria bacterium]|nr:general secretion pathway protein GspK [Pseudomonadota bacterium]
MLLAIYSKESASTPRVVEGQVAFPIELRETINVFDYAIRQIEPDKVTADTRWTAQTEIMTTQSAALASLSGPIQQLREILRQLNFDLKLPDAPQAAAIISSKQAEQSTARVGSTKEFTAFTRFLPGPNPYPLQVGDTVYQVRVRPVTALPNLNQLDGKTLQRYLVFLGLERTAAERLAAVITDWHDADSFTSAGGAEDGYYLGQPWSYRPRNASIQRWDELIYLKDGNADLIDFLRHHFTIFGADARVHINYATPEQIAVLADLDVSTVKRAIEHVRNPSLALRDVGLADVIGSEAARAFNGVATAILGDDLPVMIEIAGPRMKLSAVYDAKKKKLLDFAHRGFSS